MDTITVRIPAAPQFLQVVRLVAAGLASRLGFTIDDIEDLKIAVDELAAYLTGSQGRDGILEITFSVADDRIEIQGTGKFEGEVRIKTDLTDFSRQILTTVADEAWLHQDNGIPRFGLTKTRQS
jgi:serine/threonine-protein kinase RsbW